MVFSVYMKMSNKTESHIKFGGYDDEGALNGVADNPDFKFLRTSANDTWRLKLLGAGLFEKHIHFEDDRVSNDERFVQFDLTYPFTYIPMQDFEKLADIINKEYNTILCPKNVGKCQTSTPCN